MRILYFTRAQSPHDLRFLAALAKTRHQVAVLCLDGVKGRSWPQGIQELFWPQAFLDKPGKNIHARVKALKDIVNEFKPDVVHAGPIQEVAYIAARAGIRPLVSMSWGSDLLKEADQSWRSRWVTRYTLRHTTVLAADCNTVGKKAVNYGYKGPVKVFPWGVDLQHFSPSHDGTLRKQLGWDDKFIFLSNRTLEPLYGVDVIAWAFISASQQNDQLRLLLYGKGSQQAKLQALFEKAGILEKVHFGGFASLEQLPDIYHSADVYLSASHSDGSSVSLMEALACAKPVIVSDIPSNLEWVHAGREGWLFRDGLAGDLAEKMLLAANEKSLDEYALRCLQQAEAQADWIKNFAKLLSAYDEAIKQVKSL